MSKVSKTVIEALRFVAETGRLPADMHWRLRKTVIELVETVGDSDWRLNADGARIAVPVSSRYYR